MPSARSILLQNSKNHLTILRLIVITFKFEVKFTKFSHRDPHLDSAKFGLVKFGTLLALIKFAVKFSKIGRNIPDRIGVV